MKPRAELYLPIERIFYEVQGWKYYPYLLYPESPRLRIRYRISRCGGRAVIKHSNVAVAVLEVEVKGSGTDLTYSDGK